MLPLLPTSPAGRIVNVSSGLASLARNAVPAAPYAAVKLIGYSAPKAALNRLTVQLAYLSRDTATDLDGHRGTQTIPEGAVEPVRLALLAQDGPTGSFPDSKGIIPW